jgi:hypothetical protein
MSCFHFDLPIAVPGVSISYPRATGLLQQADTISTLHKNKKATKAMVGRSPLFVIQLSFFGMGKSRKANQMELLSVIGLLP